MKRTVAAAIFALCAVVLPQFTHADDLNDTFKRVNDAVAAKNYPKALDELAWAKKSIEKLNNDQIASFFPDTLAGFTGAKIQSNNALGFTSMQRNYQKDQSTVQISLTGGSGGAGGLGGLAAIGKMAAMMGGENGQDTLRVAGRTATLNTQNQPTLTIYLDSGSILELRAQGSTSADDLKTMAEAIKIDDLDKYLRGQ